MLPNAYQKQSHIILWNLFSSSLKQWEILKTHISCSILGMSETSKSDRLQCIKPSASHFNGIQSVLQDEFELNLTAKTRNERSIGISKKFYLCANVGSLVQNFCYKVIQARDATLMWTYLTLKLFLKIW